MSENAQKNDSGQKTEEMTTAKPTSSDEKKPEKKRVSSQSSDRATPLQKLLLTLFMVVSFFSLVSAILSFWPNGQNQTFSYLGIKWTGISEDARWIILALVAGAIGSFIHTATSLGDYIGTQSLIKHWIAWYILRLPVGSAIALLTYLLLRSGGAKSFEPVSPGSTENIFNLLGVSALAGMFSKKASNWLGNLADTVFKTSKDDELSDKISDFTPLLDKIVPNPLTLDDSRKPVISLVGKNFKPESQVSLNGKLYKPVYLNSTVLSLTLDDAFTSPQTVKVAVETVSVQNGKTVRTDEINLVLTKDK